MGVFHSVGAVLANYILLLVCGGSMHSVVLSFLLNMGYLVTGIKVISNHITFCYYQITFGMHCIIK
jgi:hypothetical protein